MNRAARLPLPAEVDWDGLLLPKRRIANAKSHANFVCPKSENLSNLQLLVYAIS